MAKFIKAGSLAVAGRTGFRIVFSNALKLAAKHPGAEQLITAFASMIHSIPGGDELGSELINEMPSLARTTIEPIWRKIVTHDIKQEGDRNMPRNKNNQTQLNDLVVKGHVLVASLGDDYREFINQQVAKLSPALRNIAFARMSVYNKQALENTIIDLMRKGEQADFAKHFHLDVLTEVEKEIVDTATSNGHKSIAMMNMLPVDLKAKIIEVTTGMANDSPDDQMNFDARMAFLYGDGTDKWVNASIESLKQVAELDIEMRSKFFGVKPNYMTKVGQAAKSLISGIVNLAPVVSTKLDEARKRDEEAGRRRSKNAETIIASDNRLRWLLPLFKVEE